MTIVLCGGGSGGHITPLLAVAREIKRRDSSVQLVYVGEKGGKFSHIAEDSGLFDQYHYISAGKLRRYYGESFIRKVTDIRTIVLNIRDIFRMLAGTFQAITLFRKLKPDAVLLKGGYVCVPASVGARYSGVKPRIVTHDSDALPGLSNRFAAKYADFHATGMPARYYKYPEKTVRYVGLPIDNRYRTYTPEEKRTLRGHYGVPENAKVLLITGGSNGARRLNSWVLQVLPDLMIQHLDLFVILVAGKGNLGQVEDAWLVNEHKERLLALEFSKELYNLSAIADVIIARAGATTLAEFAAQSKPCIIVPNPDLTGGHQLKNAQVYEDQESAIVLFEYELKESPTKLTKVVDELLNDETARTKLGYNLHATLPDISADKALADLLIGNKT